MSAIQPIEDYVFAGLSQRIQQVFGCICIYTTANDKTKIIARMFEGKKVQYPYIFITLQTLGHNPESYATNSLARRGLITTLSDGQAYTVRLMPANFDMELEYVTNKFQSVDQGSVIAFARRWLFARRCGYLKFNIEYGRLSLLVSSTLNETVSIPQLENKVEVETAYKVTSTLTAHGYLSEPEMGTQGVIQNIDTNDVLIDASGAVPGSQFFSFNKE